MTSPQRHQRQPGVHHTTAQLGIRLMNWTSMGGVPSGIPDCSGSPNIDNRSQPSAELLFKKHRRLMGGGFRTCTLVCTFTSEWLLNSVCVSGSQTLYKLCSFFHLGQQSRHRAYARFHLLQSSYLAENFFGMTVGRNPLDSTQQSPLRLLDSQGLQI